MARESRCSWHLPLVSVNPELTLILRANDLGLYSDGWRSNVEDIRWGGMEARNREDFSSPGRDNGQVRISSSHSLLTSHRQLILQHV